MFVWLFALVLSIPAHAANPDLAPAPLIFQGQTLFVFRDRVGSVNPDVRVKLISERLDRLVGDSTFDLSKITVHEDPNVGWEILAGDSLLMVVTRQDAKLENADGMQTAQAIAFRLKEILTADRLAKSPRELLIHSLYALLYTLGLVLAIWGIGHLYHRLVRRIEIWQGTFIRSVQIKTFEILPAERITRLLIWLLGVLRLLIVVTAFYFYVPLVLSLFPWTAKLSPVLLGYVYNPLRQIFHGFVDFIPNLFFIAVNLLVTRYVLKFVRLFFSEIEKGTLSFSGFYQEWAEPTYQLVRMLAIAFAIVIIFPYIPGSNSPAFQGVSVFLGVLVSLGSSSAVANIIAGLVLTYMRSFRVGDRVKIADTMGDIVEKTLLVTRIRTVKNVDITIPNSLVLGSHIINFSACALTKGLILHTEVTIGYDAPWRKVHELLISAAMATPGVLKEPVPFVYQSALEDSYVRYQLNAYTRESNAMASIYSLLHQNIQDAFNSAGVEIMSPSYSAIRDGNTVTIPEDKRPRDYQAPGFRIRDLD